MGIEKPLLGVMGKEAVYLAEKQLVKSGTRLAVTEGATVVTKMAGDAVKVGGKRGIKAVTPVLLTKTPAAVEKLADVAVKAEVVPGVAAKAPGGVKGFLGKIFNPIANALETAATGTRRMGNAGKLALRTGDDAQRFARVQRLSGGKMVRVLGEDARPGVVERVKNRIWFGGKIEYVVGETSGAAKGTVKRVKGAVFHETPGDAKLIRGKVNMTADDAKLYKFFDSKLNEARFLQKYAPGSIAKTEGMRDVIRNLKLKPPGPNATAAENEAFLTKLEEGLRQRYPKGYFIKGISDFNTGGNMATDSGNLAKLHAGFVKEYKPAKEAIVAAGKDVKEHLRGHAFAAGETVNSILKNPSKVIIQERMPLAKYTNKVLPRDVQPFDEFRLHVVDGHVVPGATMHRWSATQTIDRVDELAKIEQWAEKQFQKFPVDVRRKLSFAPDVVKMEDGSYKFIELNVGGESGFIYKNPLVAASISEAVTGGRTAGRWMATPLAYAARGISAVTTPILSGLSRVFRVGG